MLRRLLLVSALVLATGLAACSDDGPGGTCGAAETAVMGPVAFVAPDAEMDIAAEVEREEDVVTALEELRDAVPASLVPAVDDLAVLYEHRAEEGSDEELSAGLAAYAPLAVWAREACAPEEPIWRCHQHDRSTFHPVEELGASDAGREHVTVTDDDRTLEVWLDDDGVAVRAETVEADGPRLRSSCLSSS